MWPITLRHKYPSHFPVGSRWCWFAGARKGRKFSLDVFLSLPLTECQLHQFTPPHVWRHLSIFQISHFGANDPPWRKQFLQCGNSQISIKAQCLCLSPHRRSKFNWKTAFKVIPQLYNYTEDACLHVAQFAPIYCTFCTVKTSAPFSGCKFPSFGSKWSIIAHIQANTLLWEVLPSSFILNLRRMKKNPKIHLRTRASWIILFGGMMRKWMMQLSTLNIKHPASTFDSATAVSKLPCMFLNAN